MTAVVLPDLPFLDTPNQSARVPLDRKPTIIVAHAWGNAPAKTAAQARSRFAGNVNFMRDAASEVSANVVYGGTLGDAKGQAAQLVAWERKAWTQAAINSAALSVESADAIWHELDPRGFAQLARIVAFMCHKTNISPMWAHTPAAVGVARHIDLGALGNPDHHACPTTDVAMWQAFIKLVQHEHRRGGFRKSWGKGQWRPL